MKDQRQNGTILFYVEAPDEQQRANRFAIMQGVLRADDGWVYAWMFGQVFRDFTTPDKLQPGCRVSFEVDAKNPALATRISYRLVADAAAQT